MASASAYFSNDLAGCKAFIAKFDNTCTSATQDAGGWSTTASWVSAYTNCDTATYSGYTSAYCPGTWDSASSTCKNIPHQLCASCSTVSGTVYIRIQSNLCPRLVVVVQQRPTSARGPRTGLSSGNPVSAPHRTPRTKSRSATRTSSPRVKCVSWATVRCTIKTSPPTAIGPTPPTTTRLPLTLPCLVPCPSMASMALAPVSTWLEAPWPPSCRAQLLIRCSPIRTRRLTSKASMALCRTPTPMASCTTTLRARSMPNPEPFPTRVRPRGRIPLPRAPTGTARVRTSTPVAPRPGASVPPLTRRPVPSPTRPTTFRHPLWLLA
jgi:hypothetical protein